MTSRILFVDDEQSLLNGIERRLSADFDISTANSGEAALAALAEQGPFAVVITDMRMPKMDGIQFIKAARVQSPDSIYIMLTGNQDQTTAVQALNEGHVFRFLTKPCQSAELIQVIEGGLRQHQLVTAEKELLQKTFYGAVSVLTDVLEVSQPNVFNRSERIQTIVQSLQMALGLQDHWEYKLAARLSLLGFALLPAGDHAGVQVVDEPTGATSERFRRASATAQRLIERIPRLGTVARIIGKQPDVDGSALIQCPKGEEGKVAMGSTLLRVAIQWDDLTRQGLIDAAAIKEMRRSLPGLSVEMSDALAELPKEKHSSESRDVRLNDLEEGMVLSDDVVSADGTMLIRKGRRLTRTIIERLRCYQSPNSPPIRVCVSVVVSNNAAQLATV
jgi:DNA-binding response OmpR family regulator